MKLFLATAMGAALVAGCAPFEHGHYANDVSYQNNVGDPAGTPLVYRSGFSNGLAAIASASGFGDSGNGSFGTQQTVSAAAHRDSPHLHHSPQVHGFGSLERSHRSSSADDLGSDPFHKYLNRSNASHFETPQSHQSAHIQKFASSEPYVSASSADDLGRDPFHKYLNKSGSGHHDGSHAHLTAHVQNFTVPSVTQASFAPVQVFPQTVQQSFVSQPIQQPVYSSQPLQQGFVNQPIQQVTLQQPVQHSFVNPQIQQIAAPQVWPSAPQLIQQSPAPVQSFNAPTPIVSDIQVVPAGQSFFAPNPVRHSNILATSLGSQHRFDADGFAICDIPGHKHAAHHPAHHKTLVKKQPRPRF